MIKQLFLTKIQQLAAMFEHEYQTARVLLGLDDSQETRQALAPFLGVLFSVGLYYATVIALKILSLASGAVSTAIAIIQ